MTTFNKNQNSHSHVPGRQTAYSQAVASGVRPPDFCITQVLDRTNYLLASVSVGTATPGWCKHTTRCHRESN